MIKITDLTPECPKSQQVFFGRFFSKPFLGLPCPILLSQVSYPLVKHTHVRFQCNIQIEWNYMHSMINEQWCNLYMGVCNHAKSIHPILQFTTCDSLTASPPQKKKSTAKWYCHVAVNIWRNFGAFHVVQQTQGWLPLKTLVLSCICWAKIHTHRLQSTHKLLTRCNFYKLQWLHCSKWYLAKPAQVFWSNSRFCAFVRHRFKITTVDAWNASSWEALYSCSLCYLNIVPKNPRILPSLRFKVSYSLRAPYLPPCCAACAEQVAIPSTWRKHSWPWKICLEQLLGLVIQENMKQYHVWNFIDVNKNILEVVVNWR